MPEPNLYRSEFADSKYNYVLIKHLSHQEFTESLGELTPKGYEIMWNTFHITPVSGAYIVILRKEKEDCKKRLLEKFDHFPDLRFVFCKNCGEQIASVHKEFWSWISAEFYCPYCDAFNDVK